MKYLWRLALLVVFVMPSTTLAQEMSAPITSYHAIEGSKLVTYRGNTRVHTLELGCSNPVLTDTLERLFVMCDTKLLEIDGFRTKETRLIASYPTSSRPVSVSIVRGELYVWLDQSSTRYVTLKELQDAASTHPDHIAFVDDVSPALGDRESGKADTKDVPQGRVISVEGRTVTTDLGSDRGLEVGDRIEVYVLETSTQEGAEFTYERVLFVSRVTGLSPTQSEAGIKLNQEVPEGALVRRTQRDADITTWLVPRPAGVTEFDVHARPILSLGNIGVGMLLDANIIHNFESPLIASVRLTPLGFGLTSEGNVGAFGLAGLLGLDVTNLSFGLGLGVMRTSRGADTIDYDFDRDRSFVVPGDPATLTLNIAQEARLGPRDGGNLSFYSQFSLYENAFSFESLRVEAQLPLFTFAEGTWFIVRGGGSGRLLRYGIGEVGIRWLARGNGLSDSMFWSVTIGGGGVSSGNTFFGGPLVGIGLNYRK